MAKAKKKGSTYPVYYSGGTVKQMGMDEIKKMMMGGGVKLSKRTFAYGGKTQKFAQGGNKTESTESAAKESNTPKAKKGMFLKKKK